MRVSRLTVVTEREKCTFNRTIELNLQPKTYERAQRCETSSTHFTHFTRRSATAECGIANYAHAHARWISGARIIRDIRYRATVSGRWCFVQSLLSSKYFAVNFSSIVIKHMYIYRVPSLNQTRRFRCCVGWDTACMFEYLSCSARVQSEITPFAKRIISRYSYASCATVN